MKHLSVILVCSLFIFSKPLFSQAPGYLWATSSGGGFNDSGSNVTADSSGNSFVTGWFKSPTIVFGSTTLVNSDNSGNTSDLFIVKYDPLGNVVWAKSAGGTYNDAGVGIATDSVGNIVVTGYYGGPTIVFNTDTLLCASTGLTDIFLVKFNTLGSVIWAKSAGGASLEVGSSVATGKSGAVFIVGWTNSSAAIFGSTTLTTSGLFDSFIAKYDASGNALWARSAGGTTDDRAYDVACDINGNAIITGVFQSDSIVFGSSTIYHSDSALVFDSFIAKYDPSGNAMWAESVNGNMGEISVSVATDFNGNIYTTGTFTEETSYVGAPILSINKSNAFMAKHNSTGSLVWLKTFVGPLASGHSVACDSFGNVYLLGVFNAEKIGFGTDTLVNSNDSTADFFIVKFDSLSNTVWLKSAGGQQLDSGNDLFINTDGSIYITGSFYSSTLPLGATTLYNLDSMTSDFFLLKLENSTTDIDEAYSLNSAVSFYPNPFYNNATIEIKDFKIDNSVLYLFDITGREVLKKEINNQHTEIQKGNLNPGMYFYKALSENNLIGSGKIIIQ